MIKVPRVRVTLPHISSTQLTGHRAEDTATAKFTSIVQQYASVVVETDVGAISTTDFLTCADDQSFRHSTLFNITGGDDALHRDDDDVPHGCIAATSTTKYTNAEALFGTAVICND